MFRQPSIIVANFSLITHPTLYWLPLDFTKLEEKEAAGKTFLLEVEAKYEAAAATTGTSGPYFFGTDISIVDISVLPFLARFSVILNVYRGVDLLSDPRLARLAGVLAAAKTRPAFQSTSPSPEFLTAAYFTYAGGVLPAAA